MTGAVLLPELLEDDPSIDTYAAEFAEWDHARAKLEPAWLTRARRASLARFAELGFPDALSAIAGTAFHPIAPAPLIDLERIRPHLPLPNAPHLIFAGGNLIAGPGPGLPEGVIFENLAEAVQERPEELEEHLANSAGREPDGLIALNGAFFKDGAYLHVPPGLQIRAPIQLIFLSAGSGTRSFEAPRSLLRLEADSRASVVLISRGLGGETEILTSARLDLELGEGAHLDLLQLTDATGRHHFSTIEIKEKSCPKKKP